MSMKMVAGFFICCRARMETNSTLPERHVS